MIFNLIKSKLIQSGISNVAWSNISVGNLLAEKFDPNVINAIFIPEQISISSTQVERVISSYDISILILKSVKFDEYQEIRLSNIEKIQNIAIRFILNLSDVSGLTVNASTLLPLDNEVAKYFNLLDANFDGVVINSNINFENNWDYCKEYNYSNVIFSFNAPDSNISFYNNFSSSKDSIVFKTSGTKSLSFSLNNHDFEAWIGNYNDSIKLKLLNPPQYNFTQTFIIELIDIDNNELSLGFKINYYA